MVDGKLLTITQVVMIIRLPKLSYEFTGLENHYSARADVLFSLSGATGILLPLPLALFVKLRTTVLVMLIWTTYETNLACVSSSNPQSFHDFTRQAFITHNHL